MTTPIPLPPPIRVDDPPSLLGAPYRPLRLLAWGDATEVIEALAPRGERVAVKVARRGHARPREVAARLLREVTVLGLVDHPAVVRLLDVGATADGRPYFVMPRLAGDTLRDRLRRAGPLSPARARACVVAALDGLHAAHCLGAVHRDVKPANLVVGDGGDGAVVIDFGIASLEGSRRDEGRRAHVLGTPRYMAPEQILGDAVDARADVYAAGVVLFEAIAGRAPFDARAPLDLLRAHLAAAPPPLGRFADVPRELERVVARCLDKRPDARWPSARALADALRAVELEPRRSRLRPAPRAGARLGLAAAQRAS
jgi:serine/threonine-protein kinase